MTDRMPSCVVTLACLGCRSVGSNKISGPLPSELGLMVGLTSM